jgi:hypothetical protein
LGKLNLVKFAFGGLVWFRLEPIFDTASAASKTTFVSRVPKIDPKSVNLNP